MYASNPEKNERIPREHPGSLFVYENFVNRRCPAGPWAAASSRIPEKKSAPFVNRREL